MTAAIFTALPHPLEERLVWRCTDNDPHVIAIVDMPLVWRLQVVLMLLEEADARARRYSAYLAWDHRPGAPIGDARAWIVSTPLFRALLRELPAKRGRLAALAPAADRTVLGAVAVLVAANRGATC